MVHIPDELEGLSVEQWTDLTSNLLDYDLESLVGIHVDDGSLAAGLDAQVGPPRAQFSQQSEDSRSSNSNQAVSPNWDVPVKIRDDSIEHIGDDVGVDSLTETSGGTGMKSGSINKATREKLRRERLNERFSELASLLSLKGTNIDKLRVLSEAIQSLKSLREETKQLKSTNHHLHMANTMTSEMAVSLLKAQGGKSEGENGNTTQGVNTTVQQGQLPYTQPKSENTKRQLKCDSMRMSPMNNSPQHDSASNPSTQQGQFKAGQMQMLGAEPTAKRARTLSDDQQHAQMQPLHTQVRQFPTMTVSSTGIENRPLIGVSC
mmetsp:Transcript_13904/g.26697  ORF Transcript_13904/g.26697 Transcript_13904/m.26697 type:complete len:319 (-) Transcript_13904:416-1372(-)